MQQNFVPQFCGQGKEPHAHRRLPRNYAADVEVDDVGDQLRDARAPAPKLQCERPAGHQLRHVLGLLFVEWPEVWPCRRPQPDALDLQLPWLSTCREQAMEHLYQQAKCKNLEGVGHQVEVEASLSEGWDSDVHGLQVEMKTSTGHVHFGCG